MEKKFKNFERPSKTCSYFELQIPSISDQLCFRTETLSQLTQNPTPCWIYTDIFTGKYSAYFM